MNIQSDKTGQEHKVGPLTKLRRTITAGITVIVPLWVTSWALQKLFNWADGFSVPLITQFAGRLGYPDFHIPGLGFLLTFIIIWVVGAIAANVVGKRLLQSGREALERLPLVRTIYAPVQQLMDTMLSPDKVGFKKVVMVEYPRKGVWAVAFLAGDVPNAGGAEPVHSIFVPTAPNPTTGFILILPADQLRSTDLSVESAFQMMLSGGVAIPPTLSMPAAKPDSGTEPTSVNSAAS
jgi:uncharacterized membrane protein